MTDPTKNESPIQTTNDSISSEETSTVTVLQPDENKISSMTGDRAITEEGSTTQFESENIRKCLEFIVLSRFRINISFWFPDFFSKNAVLGPMSNLDESLVAKMQSLVHGHGKL